MHFTMFKGIFFFIIKNNLRFIRENVVSYEYKCYNWDSTNWERGRNIEILAFYNEILLRGIINAVRLLYIKNV